MSCSCRTDAETDLPAEGCSAGESFALQVLGDEMQPEFNPGDIIIVEPDGALGDGCFVLARAGDDWLLRQLRRHSDTGGWLLHALNEQRADLPDLPLPDLQAVHGVVIQKAVPGKRRLSKFYV